MNKTKLSWIILLFSLAGWEYVGTEEIFLYTSSVQRLFFCDLEQYFIAGNAGSSAAE